MNDSVYTNKTDIVNKLNEFYIDSIKDIVDSIPCTRNINFLTQNEDSFDLFRKISVEELDKIVNDMNSKTATGDKISIQVKK